MPQGKEEEEKVLHGRAVIQAAALFQSRWIWPKAAASYAKPSLEQRKE